MAQRKRYGGRFKAKVAIESVVAHRIGNEIGVTGLEPATSCSQSRRSKPS